MRVSFRVDSSHRIGTGHLMRCLTLADALRQRGVECRFVSRALAGHASARIAEDGFELVLLPAPDGSAPGDGPAHAAWAGVDWRRDAAETRAALDAAPPDWLVVDHYAFDRRWEDAARPPGTRLLVIDDLADRPHAADILLDQNLGRSAADYDGLVPPGARVLTGPRHALLRPEFALAREESLARRQKPALRHLMISMGGTDADNATGQVLDVLAAAGLPADTGVTVVMGATAPFLEQVREQAARMPFATTVRTNVRDMARLMVESDLAIGAAGNTSWERCCLGLPTLLLTLAENQKPSAQALADSGAAVLLGELADGAWASRLVRQLSGDDVLASLHAMSQNAWAITDGRGCDRVVGELLGGAC